MSVTRVLFVCMGNICRSPVAEALFRARIEAAGLQQRYRCDSAGTHGYHTGNPPDPRSIAVADQAGLDIRSQRSRALSPDDFEKFDWIICMDGDNISHIEQEFGGRADARLRRLFADEDVADPYYGGDSGFADMLQHLNRGIAALIKDLEEAA